MDDGFLSKLERFGASHWQPVTFLERGVSMPFTTPMLLGARTRPLDPSGNNAGLELLVPNPSGGEGIYILPWNALTDLCTPSLHDQQVWLRVADLRAPTPRRLRAITRTVAAEGYAGRDAARAAAAALAADRDARMLTHYLLLLRMLEQTEVSRSDLPPARTESPERIARRVRAVIGERLGDVVGGPDAAFRALEDLAEVLHPAGLPGNTATAALPRLVAELAALAQTLQADAVDDACAALVVASAEVTMGLAHAALGEAQGLADDVTALLRRWLADPQDIRKLAGRPDWLLDGWDLVLGLWRDAGGEALRDMALLVPVVPAEAANWNGFDLSWEAERQGGVGRRIVQANHDWRTGRLLQVQRRNERVRTFAA